MRLALVYLALITVAELLTSAIAEGIGTVSVGIILHSIILFALILHGAITRQTSLRRLLLILALAPLIRILSISLPLQNRPLVDWYLLIGSLLFLGAFVATRMTGIGFQRMGFTLKDWPRQLAIAFIGIALGITEYFILHPKPLLAKFEWGEFLYASFVLMIFTGLLEEFIFRGLVQEAATGLMGRFGLLYGATLFAVLHIGYLSLIDFAFVFIVGLLFGFIVQKTRSLLGVTLAHGLTNITMYLVFPFLLAGLPGLPAEGAPVFKEVLEPRQLPTAVLPVGTHFPGRLVTSTPDPRTAQPTTSPFPTSTWTETLVPVATLTPRSAATGITCSSPPAGWVVYIVQAGDTLFRIGQAHGASVALLRSANCLNSTVIARGQRLYVPNVGGQPQAPTASPIIFATEEPTGIPEVPTATEPPPAPSDTPDPNETP